MVMTMTRPMMRVVNNDGDHGGGIRWFIVHADGDDKLSMTTAETKMRRRLGACSESFGHRFRRPQERS